MASQESIVEFNPFNNDYECNICYEYCYGNKRDCRTCSAALCEDCYQRINQDSRLRNKCPTCREHLIPEPTDPPPEDVSDDEQELDEELTPQEYDIQRELNRDPISLMGVAINNGADDWVTYRDEFFMFGRLHLRYIDRINGFSYHYDDGEGIRNNQQNLFESDYITDHDTFELAQKYRIYELRGTVLHYTRHSAEVVKRNRNSVKLESSSSHIINGKTYKFMNPMGRSDKVADCLNNTGGEIIKIPNKPIYLISQYSNTTLF